MLLGGIDGGHWGKVEKIGIDGNRERIQIKRLDTSTGRTGSRVE